MLDYLVRILGILQRLALCYGVNLFVHWITDYGTDFKKMVLCGIFMALLIPVYLSMMLTWSDESIGCPKENNLDPFCNFAGYVDRTVFSQAHIMEFTDPEGLISTLTAVLPTYIGYLMGLMVIKMRG